MKTDDLPRIRQLGEQLGYPVSDEEMRARFYTVSNRKDAGLFVAESPEGEVLGWIHLDTHYSLLSDARCEVWATIVDEKYRKRGIGSALMKKAESWAAEHGLPIVRFGSNVQRERAHKFYERLGYKVIKMWKVFSKQV